MTEVTGVAVETTRRRHVVRGVAGDEHAVLAVLLGHGNPQIPEAHVVELGLELEAGRLVQQA